MTSTRNAVETAIDRSKVHGITWYALLTGRYDDRRLARRVCDDMRRRQVKLRFRKTP
jgi:hypothetical protein